MKIQIDIRARRWFYLDFHPDSGRCSIFWDDVCLVEEAIAHYGLLLPFLDAGGLKARDITIADYSRTLKTGRQRDRYIHLTEDPFTKAAGGPYEIINPQYGHPTIEELALKRPGEFGTIVCLSVLEHVVNPFEVFEAFQKLLKLNGLLVCSTVFSFPKHDAPHDYWRLSHECLEMLARRAGLEVLEVGERLHITADMGILNTQNGKPQEIISTFVIARKW